MNAIQIIINSKCFNYECDLGPREAKYVSIRHLAQRRTTCEVI